MPARVSSRLRTIRRTALRSLIASIAVGALLLPAVPSVSAAPICERTFGGDASGANDVTSSLASFLNKHDGKRLCLRKNGTYRVDGTVRVANVSGLRLNGRNAILRPVSSSSASAQRQQLKIEASRNVVVRNIRIRGANTNHTSYVENRQHEHGIALYGGYDIKIIDVTVTDTYGDGIYVSYIPDKIAPPSTVKVKRATVSRVGRNGIAVVGGRWIVITKASISKAGLHAVDVEPDTSDANIQHFTLKKSYLREFGQANIYTGYALAIDGWEGVMRDLRILDNRADRFNATVLNNHGGVNYDVVMTGNRSDKAGHAYLENIRGLTFASNSNITPVKINVN